MKDYKELIDTLKRLSNKPETYQALFYTAADAIEQLVKERDAAVADIKKCWLCASCHKHIEGKEWCFCYYFDPETDSDGCTTCVTYEWRGVQE